MSDIKNEIPDIELILFILEKEKEEGINGMYKVSHELPELIIHFRKTKTIFDLQLCIGCYEKYNFTEYGLM